MDMTKYLLKLRKGAVYEAYDIMLIMLIMFIMLIDNCYSTMVVSG